MSVQTRETFSFEVDGTSYETDRPQVSIPDMLVRAGLPAGTALVELMPDGTQRNVTVDERIDLEDARHFKRRPKFKRGGPATRAAGESQLLRARYPHVELASDGSWLIVRRWPLPAGWTVGETDLLVLIPAGYPATSPDSFYVDTRVALGGGREPSNSSANQQVLDRQWRFFSWHLDDTWRPHADPHLGDNLLTYVLACAARMAELN